MSRNFASRLSHRRTKATSVTLKEIDGTVVESGLTADHQQTEVKERSGPLGEVSTKIVDLFFFNRNSAGSFPAVTEKIIIEWGGVDYNVFSVMTIDIPIDHLKVATERAR